jgi:hypothetical protein
MSFNATVSLSDNSRHVDLNEMPLFAAYARCVKRYIQDPSHQCEIRPGQQNCKYYKKGNSGCELVSLPFNFFSFFSFGFFSISFQIALPFLHAFFPQTRPFVYF